MFHAKFKFRLSSSKLKVNVNLTCFETIYIWMRIAILLVFLMANSLPLLKIIQLKLKHKNFKISCAILVSDGVFFENSSTRTFRISAHLRLGEEILILEDQKKGDTLLQWISSTGTAPAICKRFNPAPSVCPNANLKAKNENYERKEDWLGSHQKINMKRLIQIWSAAYWESTKRGHRAQSWSDGN